MSKQLEKMFWRRGEVRGYLGLSEQAMTDMIASGHLHPTYLGKGKRAFFKRAEVMALANSDTHVTQPAAQVRNAKQA